MDKNLKVHGTDNIYVCSNAAFSSLGAVNPTLTLTSLAIRLGDQLVSTHIFRNAHYDLTSIAFKDSDQPQYIQDKAFTFTS